MAYYNTCPECGAHLDPGEKCTCREPARKRTEYFENHLKVAPGTGQIAFRFESDVAGNMENR